MEEAIGCIINNDGGLNHCSKNNNNMFPTNNETVQLSPPSDLQKEIPGEQYSDFTESHDHEDEVVMSTTIENVQRISQNEKVPFHQDNITSLQNNAEKQHQRSSSLPCERLNKTPSPVKGHHRYITYDHGPSTPSPYMYNTNCKMTEGTLVPITPSTCSTSMSSYHSSKFEHHGAFSPFTLSPAPMALSYVYGRETVCSHQSVDSSSERLIQPLNDSFIQNLQASFHAIQYSSYNNQNNDENENNAVTDYTKNNNCTKSSETDTKSCCSDNSFVVTVSAENEANGDDNDSYNDTDGDLYCANACCDKKEYNILYFLSSFFSRLRANTGRSQSILEVHTSDSMLVDVVCQRHEEEESTNNIENIKLLKTFSSGDGFDEEIARFNEGNITKVVSSPPYIPNLMSNHTNYGSSQTPMNSISPRQIQVFDSSDAIDISSHWHPIKFPQTSSSVNKKDPMSSRIIGLSEYKTNSSSFCKHQNDISLTSSSSVKSPQVLLNQSSTSLPKNEMCKGEIKQHNPYQVNSTQIPNHCELDSSTTISSSSPRHHLVHSTVASIDFDVEMEWLEQASKCEEEGDYTTALFFYGKCLNNYCQQSSCPIQANSNCSATFQTIQLKERKLISFLHKIGIVQWKMGSYDLSLHALKEALTKAKSLETKTYNDIELLQIKRDNNMDVDKVEISDILNSLGRTHVSRGAYDLAMNCHEESMIILKAMNTNSFDIDERLQPDCFEINVDDETSLIEEKELLQELNDFSNCDDKSRQRNDRQQTKAIRHQGIARTLTCIGTIHQLRGNYQLAMARFRDSLYIQKKTVGSNHLDIGETLNAIGAVYEQIGDHGKAMRCYKRARRIYVDQLGDIHVDVAVTLNNIGQVYHSLKKFKKAMNAYNDALIIMRQVLGEHRNIATILFNKGLVYVSIEQYDRALKMFKETLKIQRHKLGDNHIDVALTMESISNIYEKLGKIDKAITLVHKSLKIRRVRLGQEHLVVANSLARLGQLYLIQGKIMNEATRRFRAALNIYRSNNVGEEDDRIVTLTRKLHYLKTEFGMNIPVGRTLK